ncbi:MAG: amidohydrolase [Saprospiraceae bacterium]|nr:amidohydrolase [Saprospiraceae bacterium]
MKKVLYLLLALFLATPLQAQLASVIDEKAASVEEQVIEWRRDIHQYPELSNREVKTAAKVAAHLERLGMEVQTGIAHTGVIGILDSGKPGPVVGLRADMDALPVIERVDLPFASKEMTTYLGQEVGIMHACGHDTHVAILMGVAQILTDIKEELKGKVVFIFQPAEEGAPPGENGGAKMMVEEGILSDNNVEVVFGLHINSLTEVGKIRYRPGGIMAAADRFTIKVNGKQSHGSMPWAGVDPIVIGSQIVMGLQTIVSRQTELTREAAVISVGKFHAGVRNNIIPESAELVGTIRTLDVGMQDIIHEKIEKTAKAIAEAGGATADVEIQRAVPVTYNDIDLTRAMLPTLERTAGSENVIVSAAVTGAEDFSFYANEVPSFFFFLGGMSKGMSPLDAAPHHTPDFFIDEAGMPLGVRSLCNLTLDYMHKAN